MGRLASMLAIVSAAGVLAAGCGGDGSDLGYEPLDVHPAETAGERAAAEAGERYARAVESGDVRTACELAVGQAAERLGCGTARPRVTGCRGREAYHAKDEGDHVAVRLDQCALHVARRGGVWRVTEDAELEGHA